MLTILFIVICTWPCQHHILFSFRAGFQFVITQSILVRIVWNLKHDPIGMLSWCSQQYKSQINLFENVLFGHSGSSLCQYETPFVNRYIWDLYYWEHQGNISIGSCFKFQTILTRIDWEITNWKSARKWKQNVALARSRANDNNMHCIQ